MMHIKNLRLVSCIGVMIIGMTFMLAGSAFSETVAPDSPPQPYPSPGGAVVFHGDFSGTSPKFTFTRGRIDGTGNITAASSEMAKFTVPNDGISYRAEVATPNSSYGSYVYQFSNWIPSDYPGPEWDTILAQWHGYPLSSTGKDTNPPIALSVLNDNWLLRINYLKNPNDTKPTQIQIPIAPVTKGQWNYWNMSITWSDSQTQGQISLSLNGQIVATYTGVNNYNQNYAPYFKVGIYRPNWNPSKGIPYPTGGPPVQVWDGPVTISRPS